LYVAAIGNQSGFISLPQQSETDKSRLSLALPMPDATALGFRVPIRTLDSIICELNLQTIKLLKIDVEGFELQVFEGLKDHIGQVNHIIFEALHDSEEECERSEAACTWLTNEGFELRRIDGEKWSLGNEIVEGNLWATRRLNET
jgi:hypothetical protein